MNFTVLSFYLALGLVAGYVGKYFLGLDLFGTGLLCLGLVFVLEGVKRLYEASKA